MDKQLKFRKVDEKTLTITDDNKHSLSIILDNKKTNAKLIIDNNPIPKYEFLAKEDKDRLNVYLKENNVLTVWFNAWRYEREQQYALIALMKTIAYAMGDSPMYSQVKPILLRGLGIIGKDILRNLALRYAMTERGVGELEKTLLPKMDILVYSRQRYDLL